ncbi:MAG TPA: phosphatase PAP2 family protein, partial [Arachidicoccus sp.]
MKELSVKELSFSLRKSKGFREVLLFISVAVFYKVSRFIAIGDVHTAFQNAYKVVHFEQAHALFYEISLQHIFLKATMLIRFLNRFYMVVHVPSIIVFFFWLFRYHRDKYYFIRNGFLFANFITLFIFTWYPCAPPRMLANIGFVDTLLQVSHLNLYNSNMTHYFNQYAAMPSMHFGTALIIGICVFIYTKNWLLKSVMVLYPAFV